MTIISKKATQWYPNLLFSGNHSAFGVTFHRLPKNLPDDLTQELIDNYYRKVKLAENGRAVSDCNFAVVLDSVGEYQASLLELYTEYRDQLTMCDPAKFDTLYDELAKKYADAGYQEIVNERKEAYEAGQSTKLQK